MREVIVGDGGERLCDGVAAALGDGRYSSQVGLSTNGSMPQRFRA